MRRFRGRFVTRLGSPNGLRSARTGTRRILRLVGKDARASLWNCMESVVAKDPALTQGKLDPGGPECPWRGKDYDPGVDLVGAQDRVYKARTVERLPEQEQ